MYFCSNIPMFVTVKQVFSEHIFEIPHKKRLFFALQTVQNVI